MLRAIPVGLVVASALALPSALDRLVLLPPQGAKVARTFTWNESMESVRVSLLLDGEETAEAPTVTSEVKRQFQVTFADTFVRTADNLPLELIRRFEDISGEVEAALGIELPSGVSELEVAGDEFSELGSIGVRFEWDPDSEEYEVAYADDYVADPEWIAGLRPGGHFVECLPEGGKAEPDVAWAIDPDRFLAALAPFGDLRIELDSDLDVVEGVLDPLRLPGPFALLDGKAGGRVKARVVGEDDGLVRITIDFEVDSVSERAESLAEVVRDAMPEGVRGELRAADYKVVLEGSARLAWNTNALRFESFDLTADATVEIGLEVIVTADGVRSVFTLEEERSGEVRFRAATE